MIGSPERRARISDLSPFALLLPPVAVTALLWASSPHESETGAVLAAFGLLLMPWGSFLCWRAGGREGLPVFAVIAATYWVFFGLALLWAPRALFLAGSLGTFVPPEEVVTTTMLLTVVGVMAMWFGTKVPVSVWVPARLPDIVDVPRSWAYVRAVLLCGLTCKMFPSAVWLFGAGGRQAMTILSTVVPDVAFVLLLVRYMAGRASRPDKATLIVAAGILVIGGLASGWLGAVAGTCVLYAAVTLMQRRRIPWLTVSLTVAVVLFLQVGKNQFRNMYWAENADASVNERVTYWLGQSASQWGTALDEEGKTSIQSLASQTLQRTSLLPQVAHVLDMTPSDVPFQKGATYGYLAVTFVPRMLWPDKPSISDANKFYQVEYGLTTERGLDSVSIAVGSLAEAYINFGWPGVVGIMFVVGLVLGVYERTFALTRSSALFLAIGLALVPGFLTIESQLGQYLGGVVQQAVFAAAVFFPITKRRTVGTEPGASPRNAPHTLVVTQRPA